MPRLVKNNSEPNTLLMTRPAVVADMSWAMGVKQVGFDIHLNIGTSKIGTAQPFSPVSQSHKL